ncbi:hypothetical protein [Anaerorhabdus sp.]|uniref:hypothetical protein n=1 Tax=Anaerorhabdus sp. TaxID=1872524 RepID=UPI002B1EDB97|nr:hypothetical protein [Anaerorhabdus sp.]MEA4875436.1 hypothetical protein [Anaerorhabdus sp.]
MKKIIISIIVLLLLALGGGVFYIYTNIYNSKQKDLGITVTEQDQQSLNEKLAGTLNDETGRKEFTAELSQAESSILLENVLNNVVPCSDVQTVITPDNLTISMTAMIDEGLKEKLNAPIPLPDSAGLLLVASVDTIDGKINVNVTKAEIGGLELPTSFISKYNTRISQMFLDQGYNSVTLQDGSLSVSGFVKD